MRTLITEELGKDELGILWYVLIDETLLKSKNNVSFYVFPEENLGKDVRWKALHIMKAYLSLIAPDEGVILDFAHNDYDTSYAKSDKTSLYTGSVFDELFSDNEDVANWENRGIGTLLLNRIESWALNHGLKLIKGSLSGSDNIQKLKTFYPKNGWTVEIPGKTYVLPDFVIKGVGIVFKVLKT